jgi:hypothetical protein
MDDPGTASRGHDAGRRFFFKLPEGEAWLEKYGFRLSIEKISAEMIYKVRELSVLCLHSNVRSNS